jgi:hypothetical protein
MSELAVPGEEKEQRERKFYFIKGSVHQNHLDAPFILHVRFAVLSKKDKH